MGAEQMRERQRRSEEKREVREDLYYLACEIIEYILSLPMVKANLEFSLQFPRFAEEDQVKVFHDLVEESARMCICGEPSMNISPEFQCNYLIGTADLVTHARPALERAIALCRESGTPLPRPLREWEPSSTRPRPGGPRPQLQDAKAIRDHVIALAVSAVVDVQGMPNGPQTSRGSSLAATQPERRNNLRSCSRRPHHSLCQQQDVSPSHLQHDPQCMEEVPTEEPNKCRTTPTPTARTGDRHAPFGRQRKAV